MSRPGRPTKLTPRLQVQIVHFIAQGNTIRAACGVCGIDPTTYDRWLRKGRAAKRGRYANFALAVERAQEAFETRMIGAIATAAPKDWRAARELLALRKPQEYGQKATLGVNVQGPIEFKVRYDDEPADAGH